MNELQQLPPISGFWRRLAAFFIDVFILGTIGFVFGVFLSEYFVRIGVWGRLLGFCIASLYFGILNSRLCNGQTVGKILLGIQVVDKKGGLISPGRSFLRYSVLGIPYFLNGAQFPDHVLLSWAMYPLSFFIFGVGLSIIYLIIFNRQTRQSLHDIMVGTYVVRQSAGAIDGGNIWKLHYGVVATLLAVTSVAPFFANRLAEKPFFKEMSEVRKAVIEAHDFAYADVSEGKTFMTTTKQGSSETSFITMSVFLKTDDVNNQGIANSVARTILATHAASHEKDTIQIVLIYGYDIGITTSRHTAQYSYTPREWMAFVQEDSKALQGDSE